ncbi:MAG: aminotransferase class I/II-fold pyridoxal phosphate-dependent enzyme [Chitinophagaceae bacterium]
MTSNRRDWLKQTTFAALGLGISLRSLANEEGLPRQFGSELGIINLGSNENPYGISPNAKKAISDLLNEANRYQYNIASLKNFKKEVAAYYNLTPEQILLMPGSGEGLNLAARYYNGGNIIAGDPTFMILPRTAKLIGTKVIEVPLTEDKVHDLDAMLKAINSDTKLVYICNPANPTTTILKTNALRSFCEEASKKTVVLLDEAYMDYADPNETQTMLPMIEKNPNIVILRTFSKIHAMAGMRMGFLAAHPSVIEKLGNNLFSNTQFCTSSLTQTAALASIKDEEHRKESKLKNAAARKYTIDELKKMNYKVADSHTNFLFFQLKNFKGDFAKEMIDNHNILLRSYDRNDGNYCRVSLGTIDEMKQFIKVFKEMNA